jgi:hypothetical protein
MPHMVNKILFLKKTDPRPGLPVMGRSWKQPNQEGSFCLTIT